MLIIFGLAPRCGSTALSMAINSLGYDIIEEPFNPENFNKNLSEYDLSGKTWSEEYGGILWPEGTTKRIISDISSKHDGFKHLSYQADGETNYQIIENNTSILLFRRNIIESLVSNWLSMSYFNLTGVAMWHHRGRTVYPEFYTLTREAIPKQWIDKHIHNYKSSVKFLQKAKKLKTCLIVSYEDLYGEEGAEYFFNICNHLNIPKKAFWGGSKWKDILGPKRKMNSRKSTYKLIPNIDEILEMEQIFLSSISTLPAEHWCLDDLSRTLNAMRCKDHGVK
jgi:hypothetical protein